MKRFIAAYEDSNYKLRRLPKPAFFYERQNSQQGVPTPKLLPYHIKETSYLLHLELFFSEAAFEQMMLVVFN